MEEHEMNDSWVDERMAALEPGAGWQPNAGRALARLRELDRARAQRNRWLWGGLAAVVACVALLALQAPRVWRTSLPKSMQAVRSRVVHSQEREPAIVNPPAVGRAQQPVMRRPRVRAEIPAKAPELAAVPEAGNVIPVMPRSFKESGSATAGITCELYLDYECPPCARIYTTAVAFLIAEYVKTGKVKLIHHDMPMALHRYAKLAARYANAAGHLGQYDAVAAQLFKTQGEWRRDGNIDAQVASVLAPGLMEEVRQMVSNPGGLDDAITADAAMAAQDHITAVPALVIEFKGKRQVFAPMPGFEELKAYLDGLASQ
jgi:protein-disulfide isomerase